MSAIDELRRMLDERGVAHSDHYLSTTWRDRHGILHLAGEPMVDGSLVVDMLTPEQAIAATLGGTCETCPQMDNPDSFIRHLMGCERKNAERTCRNISDPPEGFLCSSCGWGDFAEPSHLLTTAKFTGNDRGPNHCPNCGAKVVDE